MTNIQDGNVGNELLANAGLPFDVTSGELYVNLVDETTGAISKHRIDIDAAHTTLLGGAFLAWEDSRPGAANTYVQRVDSTGASLWAAGGVPVSSPRSVMNETQICPDGLGGLLVAWTEHYPSSAYNNAYVQGHGQPRPSEVTQEIKRIVRVG